MSNLTNKKNLDTNNPTCHLCNKELMCGCTADTTAPPPDSSIPLEEQLRQCEVLKQEYLDGWQRAKADYVNARREEERLRHDLVKFAKTDLVSDLINMVDNFDRAFANKETWEKVDKNWRIGVEYIYNQFMDILKNNGVSEVGQVGEKFDASIHESVGTKETDSEEKEDTVAQIVLKGFNLNDRTVRPARVIIWHFIK